MQKKNLSCMAGLYGSSVTVAVSLLLVSSQVLAGNPAQEGKWSGVVPWPNIPLHAVLTPKKEVLTFGTDKTGKQGAQLFYDVWDPAKGTGKNSHYTLPNTTATDLFCTAPVIIPSTGDILLAGGDQRVTGPVNTGIADTFIFNSKNRSLKPTTSMAYARWYPTATALANGELFLHGGRAGKKQPILVPEIFNPKTSQWRSLTGASNPEIVTDTATRWFYPRNFLIPDGRIFGVSGGLMYYLTTDGQGTNRIVGRVPRLTQNFTSTAVMYQPGKILHLGGGETPRIKAPASKRAVIIDVNGANPVIKSTGSMRKGRSWANSTVLPTGDVLVTGGSSVANTLTGTVEVPEIWSPATGAWTALATAKIARLYHSTALLLPDGRILVGGGGAPGPLTNINAEIFSPPYLFAADGTSAKRLRIVNAPAVSDHGKTIAVKYAIASGQQKVARATLIRLGSATHSFNMEQRFIELNLQQTEPDQVSVRLPVSANIALPGFYMLFLLDDKNVPSEGHVLKITVPGSGGGGTDADAGINIENATVNENDGAVHIRVQLSSAQSLPVRVQYATKQVSAVQGSDFRGRRGTVRFNPGQTVQTILIPLIDNSKAESVETFTVNFWEPVNARLEKNQATVTINDDDNGSGNGTQTLPTLNINNVYKAEGRGSAKIEVRLDAVSDKTVTVNYTTRDGSARSGPDYTARSGVLRFNPGQSSQYIFISVLQDNKSDSRERFAVVMSNPANAVLGKATGFVEIRDLSDLP